MALSPDALRARIAILLDAQGRARAAQATTTAAQVRLAWRALDDPYDPAKIQAFTGASSRAVRAGRRRTNDVTDSYLRRVLDAMGVKPPRGHAVAAEDPRVGVPIAREYARVPAVYRWEVSRGSEPARAGDLALARAEQLVDLDLSLAARDAAHQVFDSTPQVTGYRRILRPELSRTGTCGLCIAASTRLYFKADLLPLHGSCRCEVLPLVDGRTDVVRQVSDEDLALVYELAGGTSAAKLKKVRVVVHEHGELGPVLREQGHAFRDAGQVSDATRRGPGKRADPSSSAEPPSSEPSARGRGGDGGRPPPQSPAASSDDRDLPGPILPDSTLTHDLPGRPGESAIARTATEPPSARILRAEPGRVAPDDDPDRHFSAPEATVADWLRERGYEVWSVLKIEAEGIRTPDAIVRGPTGAEITAEFKTPRANSAAAVRAAFRAARNQSHRVIIDARTAGTAPGEVKRGLALAIVDYGTEIDEAVLLGVLADGEEYHLRWS